MHHLKSLYLRAKRLLYYGEKMVAVEKSSPYPLVTLVSAILREMVPRKAPAAPLKVSVEIQ